MAKEKKSKEEKYRQLYEATMVHMASLDAKLAKNNQLIADMMQSLGDNHNDKYEKAQQMAMQETIRRTNDIWGLDYDVRGDGHHPAGNQVGRREILPKDLQAGYNGPELYNSLNQWLIELNRSHTYVVNMDAFMVIYGFFISEKDIDKLTEIKWNLNGCQMVTQAMKPYECVRRNGKYLKTFDIPASLNPTADINLQPIGVTASSKATINFGLMGQVVAKRPYLIK